MACQQCQRPSFIEVGEANARVRLCLDCWQKLSTIQHMDFVRNAAMLNHAMDSMDAVIGIPTGGRIPIAAIAQAMNKGNTYNNISISNSQVGVLNTGELAKIDAAITLTKGSDAE